MEKEKYNEMVKFVSYVIQVIHVTIIKGLELENVDPSEIIERYNPFITSFVQSKIIKVYGEKDAYEFFKKFSNENAESLSNHIETMIENGELLIKNIGVTE